MTVAVDRSSYIPLASNFSGANISSPDTPVEFGDPAVRAAIPFERRNTMRHNQRDDVVLYLRTWADLLEQRLLATVSVPAYAEAVLA